MDLLKLPLYEITWYGLPLWCCFIAIAFCSTRYLRWAGLLLGPAALAIFICLLDAHWIFDQMKSHAESGRAADPAFVLGVLIRVLLFNTLLLPASILGLWLALRRHRAVSVAGKSRAQAR